LTTTRAGLPCPSHLFKLLVFQLTPAQTLARELFLALGFELLRGQRLVE
jgi:hypothetical protein